MKDGVVKEISKVVRMSKDKISFLIEIPKDLSLGDYAFPCFILAKEMKKNPAEIAREIARDLASKIKNKNFEKVEASGPYVNFFIDRKFLAEQVLKNIQKQKDDYGSSNIGKNQVALIEHTSINPNASPHVGRARNAIIGDSITRILRFQGFKTEVHYFVNDVGKQIAMLVLASEGKKKVSFNDLLGLYININKKMEKDPAIEKKIFDLLLRLEQGDKKIRKKFANIVKVCVKGQTKILKELDIKYNSFDYESDYLWNKKTNDLLKELESTGKLFEDEEKRIVLNQEGYNLPLKSPVLVLTRADKTSLYPLRDIAYTIDKIKKNDKDNYIVLGEDQKTYFRQIESALSLLGYKSPKPIHYSFVLLLDGKMSTRQGNVVLLEDFMQEALGKAKKELKKRYGKIDEKKTKIIAHAAIKYSLLKVSPEKNVMFDIDYALSFEGDTGPYLLYSYARARSILKKANYKAKNISLNQNVSEIEKALIVNLSSFPAIIDHAYRELNPSIIAHYSFHIAQLFNEFYHSSQVIGSKNEQFKLALVDSFSQVLKNSLILLGIQALEKM